MSDPIRTCESCSKFTECHSKDFDHVCEDYIVKCPLPRIGSKEWGWDNYQSDSGRWWSSPKNEYQVDRSGGKWRVVGEGKNGDTDARILATCGNLEDAFRFAELLARRDWRRENRGKKC